MAASTKERKSIVSVDICVHCGPGITAITHRINDGFCMVCCDPFPGVTDTKHLLHGIRPADPTWRVESGVRS